MYTPKVFRETDLPTIHRAVEADSFATWVVASETGKLEITHVPFLLDAAAGTLRVHVARANPIWRLAIAEGATSVVVFHGPHAYVSASWYEHATKQVPTWNYAVVHAHVGQGRVLANDELLAMLEAMSSHYEAANGSTWKIDDLAPSVRDELLAAIVGLSLPVDRWEAKAKLSQNRSPEDRRRVVDALKRRGSADDLAMVDLMTRTNSEFTP
ncbi:Transcriptional regulator [Labilithrix luteola]|uniref:Transcriptional regulator n=1 Tax=Labilithrix luteola TaxID=1391654 RepID=A0A0K1QEV0_9BACT|nr:FMN-binding negative transcriptional regulator [Labilithrix luteola]AKV04197.1 Transcriptional regulator [Labilithrix luteola]